MKTNIAENHTLTTNPFPNLLPNEGKFLPSLFLFNFQPFVFLFDQNDEHD